MRPASRSRTVLRRCVLVVVLVGAASACGASQQTRGGAPTAAPAAGQQPSTAGGVRVVEPAQALALAAAPGATMVDVRTPQEFATGHVVGAVNVPLGDALVSTAATWDPTASYVLYCVSGNRSGQAAAALAGLGFTDVADAGGLTGLVAAGAELTRPAGRP